MKKILFDANIVLDILLDRQPLCGGKFRGLGGRRDRHLGGLLAAHAVTTIHHLVRKEMSNIEARRIISAILSVLGVATVDTAVIQEALQLPLADFEDAVTAAAARLAGCECIVTRDPKGFRGSPVRALPPEAVTPLLDKM